MNQIVQSARDHFLNCQPTPIGEDAGYFVYALYLQGEIVYIGSSRLLLARIGQHLASGKEFDAYSAVACASESEMRLTEFLLTAEIAPKLNAKLSNVWECGYASADMLKKKTGRGQKEIRKFAKDCRAAFVVFQGQIFYSLKDLGGLLQGGAA